MANGTGNATDSPPSDGSETTNKFLAALVFNLIIGVVVLILFSLLRPKHRKIYSPRQLLLDTITPLGKAPGSIVAWFFPAFVAKDDDVFEHAGIDALVHMRFLKLCLKVSLVILPYGIVVLVPVNYYGGEDLGGLDRIAVSNISARSAKVWAHVVAAWIYTLVICYLLFVEWKNYILYRQQYLARGKAHQYAVFIRDLPDKLKDEESLKSYVQELFPDQTEDAVLAENLQDLQKLVGQHDNLVCKLEHANAVHGETGERPEHKDKCCCGKKVDSINEYESQLTTLQEQLEEEKNKDHQKLPCSFVVFKSLKLATTAGQVRWDIPPLTVSTSPAPELSSILWGNLGIGLMQRHVRTLLIYVCVFLLVVFWMIPVAFVSSIVSLQNLAKIAPFLEPVLNLSAFGTGIIEGFLSGVALMIFFIVLPIILHLLTRLEGVPNKVDEDVSVMGKLYIFVIVNKFLFLAVAGSIFAKMQEMLDDPGAIPGFLAESLPSQAVFFICYIMLVTFTGLPLELLRIGPLIVVAIKRKWLCKTQREEEAAWRPPQVAYEKVFANHLFILVVGLSYSVLAPIITPFVFLYFGFGYMVWMHQLLCVYIPVYSRGGLMWPKVFNRIIAGMIVFHLLVIGVLGLKEAPTPAALIFPLPIITMLFFFFIQQHYIRPASFLSLKVALEEPEVDPEFLKEVAEAYARKNMVPTKYELSAATKPAERSRSLEPEEDVTAPDDLESSLPLKRTEASGENA